MTRSPRTSDVVVVITADGSLSYVSPSAREVLGYPDGAHNLLPVMDFVHPDDLERSTRVAEALCRGEEAVQFENRTMCRDGSSRWLEWNTQPLPEKGLVFCVARDVTDRRLAEDELHQAQRMVEASRDELRLLAKEQAALRRVATLVASGAEPPEVFAAVAEEARGVLGADGTMMVRLDPDGEGTIARDDVGYSLPGGITRVPSKSASSARPASAARRR